METNLSEYVTLCRLVGGWTDWVQGPGGNISFKQDNELIIKRSGALLADTTNQHGWVLCDQTLVEIAMKAEQEDISHTVLKGSGKPSIETFLHCLPDKIIVHLHPAFMLGVLCSNKPANILPKDWIWIPYARPGIPLASLLFSAYVPTKKIYLLQNHGVLLVGETIQEILNSMSSISSFFKTYLPHPHTLPFTNVTWAADQFWKFHDVWKEEFIFQPIYRGRIESIKVFTPDIAVFLTLSPPSLLSDGEQIYSIGKSLQQCNIIRELYLSHQYAVLGGANTELSREEVHGLLNWDKEKERKQAQGV